MGWVWWGNKCPTRGWNKPEPSSVAPAGAGLHAPAGVGGVYEGVGMRPGAGGVGRVGSQ